MNAASYTLYKRKLRRGPVWYFRLREDPKRVWRSTHQSMKHDAEAFVETYVRQSPGPRSLAAYPKTFYVWGKCDWIKRQHAKGKQFSPAVARLRRAHLINYLFPRFGHYELDAIGAIEVENWLTELPLSNSSRNALLFSLRIILREAKRERRIPFNPLADVESMATSYLERDILSTDELKVLFPDDEQELIRIWREPRYAAMFLTLASTGVRSGEARALQWRHYLGSGLLIEQAAKGDNSIGTTKTGSKRAVLIPSRARAVLDWWRQQSPYPGDDDFIFFGVGGDVLLNKRTVTDQFRPALARAGIDVGGRNLVVHSLRHGYNTMMQATMPAEVVRQMLGHKSSRTNELYLHPTMQQELTRLEASRSLLEKAWSQ